MRKFWLIFAQSVTISLAILFVIRTLYPTLLTPREHIVEIQQSSLSATSANLSYRKAVQRAMPSVVNIFTSKVAAPDVEMDNPAFKQFFGTPQTEHSLGSGVIVTTEGFILTNHHVVAAATEIKVALADGRAMTAHIVGTDPETDLAVIKIDAQKLPAITFGHAEALRVGDVVLAIGNPFGFSQSVTQGIVSALGRSHLGINTFENFIQTDAPTNPGNSGGALIDTEGNLVGINSAIFSKSGGSMGIGFAIPVNLAKTVMEQIVLNGSVTRGWLGVEAQNLDSALARSLQIQEVQGALITGILRGGPADKAGLKPGDILLEINKRNVPNAAVMLNMTSALLPNSMAQLKIRRAEKLLILTGIVGRRPTPENGTPH